MLSGLNQINKKPTTKKTCSSENTFGKPEELLLKTNEIFYKKICLLGNKTLRNEGWLKSFTQKYTFYILFLILRKSYLWLDFTCFVYAKVIICIYFQDIQSFADLPTHFPPRWARWTKRKRKKTMSKTLLYYLGWNVLSSTKENLFRVATIC